MERTEDIRSDRIIIIGFTGPIGSGCTTVSKFLADETFEEYAGLSDLFEKAVYVKSTNKTRINSDVFRKRIKSAFAKKARLEKGIASLTQQLATTNDMSRVQELETRKEELRNIHNEIRQLLECREYTYSLHYLLDQDYYKNRLRISCSSIIVFDLVRNIEEPTNSDDNRDEIEHFRKVVKDSIKMNGVDQDLFQRVYDDMKGYFDHLATRQTLKDRVDTADLKECFKSVARIKKDLAKEDRYTKLMQDFGDNLRSTGNPFVYPSKAWVEDHKKEFQNNNYRIARYIDYIVHYYMNSEDKVNFFLVDSFRNPMCIKYLRNRYPRFCLVSLFSSAEERQNRLIAKESKKNNSSFNIKAFRTAFREKDRRDQGADYETIYDIFYKQNVSETVLISDIALNNEGIEKVIFFNKLLRYVALIVDPGCTKPSGDEMFMNMAYTMAMKSNCISRQVGAVIEGRQGYVVGAGWNDVGQGQISCGLRNIKDLKYEDYGNYVEAMITKSGNKNLLRKNVIDHLAKKYGNQDCCFCFKDEIARYDRSKKLTKHFEKVKHKEWAEPLLEDLIENLKIKRLLYCKALHAEENAIIQGAKIGGMGLLDSKMYVTTFPCELCAKKIQQSGIKEVIYVEPYPESISKELYLQDGVRKVKTRQFEGVKGYGYFKLFKPFFQKKERQDLKKDEFLENIA